MVHMCRFLALLCVFSASAFAQTIVQVADDMAPIDLASVSVMRSGAYDDSIDSVVAARDWQPAGKEFRLGITDHPVWLRLRVRNDSVDPTTAYISLPAPWIDRAELFRRDNDRWVKTVTGYRVSYSSWDVSSLYPSLRILLDANETADFYIRIESASVLNFPAYVLGRSEFRQRDRARTGINGLAIGIFLALFSVSNLLWFVSRNVKFTVYSAYILVLGLGLLAAFGNGVELLGFVGPHLLWRISVLCLLAARALFLLFIPLFFSWPEERTRKMYWISSIIATSGIILAAAGWAVRPQAFIAVAILATAIEIYLLAIELRGRVGPAAIFWCIQAIARLTAYGFVLGVIPYSVFAFYSWIFLVPLDFFALGGQFRSLSKEKDNRYAKSRITGMDVGLAVERMEQVLISGELLKDATLRLPDLARALDMAPYQLSELLNNALRKSFREYVNGLRVKAVQDALRHNPDADIGSVMRENGFRSRSVFNQAFKIQTGETPFHFKRSLRK